MKTAYREWIAGKLKALRGSVSMTQYQVADLLKLKKGTYATYEQGTAEPSIFLLKQICEIYHITMDQFMQGSPELQQPAATQV